MNSPTPEQPSSPAASRAEKAATPGTPPEATVAPTQLTPEEQMALYEKELKETDWGHQPC
jgi:hypothetical protein